MSSSTSSSSSSKVWYVTGTSTGLGKSIVQTLLNRGQRVAATSRDKKVLNDVFGPDSDSFLALQVDLSDDASIQASVRETTSKFGTIDVVVNNAGYVTTGVIEELPVDSIKDIFAVNFYAPLAVIRAIAPILRAQRSGYIVNVSSIVANVGLPALGAYCSTKAALDSVTESLAGELQPLGIKVFTVNPGRFKTDIGNPSKFRTTANSIADYDIVHKAIAQQANTEYKGDPDKLANVLFRLITEQHSVPLPVHVYIGEDSNEMAKKKAESWLQDLSNWRALTASTNRDDVTSV